MHCKYTAYKNNVQQHACWEFVSQSMFLLDFCACRWLFHIFAMISLFSVVAWVFCCRRIEDGKCRLQTYSVEQEWEKRMGSVGTEIDAAEKNIFFKASHWNSFFFCTIANSVVSSMEKMEQTIFGIANDTDNFFYVTQHKTSNNNNIRLLSPTERFLGIRAPFTSALRVTIQFVLNRSRAEFILFNSERIIAEWVLLWTEMHQILK